MDILTKKGQKSLEYERIMLERISVLKNVNIIETDKNMDAKVDGMISQDNQLTGIFESKCRDMSLMQLRKFGSWLVTFDKILDGRKLSQLLRVPFIGFLYLIPDEIIM